jgi:nitrite reductase/ring-hydroxylating ferredoxin subunit
MKHPNVHFFYLSCIFLFLNSSSCNKDKENVFPYVYVNFTINLITDPEFTRLQAQGNFQIIYSYTLGYTSLGYGNKGIIIYNAAGDNFYAFDATCPYDLPEINGVIKTTTDGVVECPKCHSRYAIFNSAMPTKKGPASYPLHEYKAYYYPSSGALNVRN